MAATTLRIGLAAGLAVVAGQASAYTMGTRGVGVLVPYAVHDGIGDTTAVALMTSDADTCPFLSGGAASAQARVHWTFFDVNSNPIKSGSFQMTHNDVYPFIWATEGGDAVKGQTGYLLFILDTNNDGQLTMGEGQWTCLAAEGFHATLADSDVAFIPTWPVENYDFAGIDSAPLNLAGLTSTSLTTLLASSPNLVLDIFSSAAFEPVELDLRYSVGGGDTTQIVLWSAEAIGGAGVTYSVELFDHEQNRKVVNLALPDKELNVIDPAALSGRPADYTNGFIRFSPPLSAGDGDADPDVCAPLAGSLPTTYTDHGCDGNGIVSFSIIHSPGFGARQTIVNPNSMAVAP